MPFTVTHVLAAIILVELFREYVIKNNKKFPRYYILIAAIGGIIPDLDIALFYALYPFGFAFEQIHRTFFHTIFIPLILFAIGFATLKFDIKSKTVRRKHLKLPGIFIILAATSLLHLILDATIAGTIMPLYPFSNFEIGLNLISIFPEEIRMTALLTLDAILLFFWIFWMEFKLKIDDYF